jgi:flagellar hook-basal body complex protein FliE
MTNDEHEMEVTMAILPINPVSLVNPVSRITKSGPESLLTGARQETGPAQSFEAALGKALNEVNDLQQQSTELNAKLASGQLQYIHQATAMAEKASLALELTLQIRNKFLDAYQEIMRTQV